jgi:hypothetical protein
MGACPWVTAALTPQACSCPAGHVKGRTQACAAPYMRRQLLLRVPRRSAWRAGTSSSIGGVTEAAGVDGIRAHEQPHVVLGGPPLRALGVVQMRQKHEVQDILAEALPGGTTTLQATLFMEELWKRYTRPPVGPPPPCFRATHRGIGAASVWGCATPM